MINNNSTKSNTDSDERLFGSTVLIGGVSDRA